ncbi:MAG: methyltransferase [Burkholderiales bacterium]|nr:methyltransferase [Burkholderiales bacterium]
MSLPTRRRRRDDPTQRLVQQITSCWRTQTLLTAVQLELPDRLATGPGDVQQLADACQCSSDGLHRLLRALCTLQVCRERRDGRFELTASGGALCRRPPDGGVSLRAMVIWWGGPMWPMWGELSYSVCSGRSARARQTGLSNYAFLGQQPEVAAQFHQAMQVMTALIAPEVARLDLWRDAHELIDVGGGNGVLACAVAAAHPHLTVTVLDRADAEPGAAALINHHALAGRVSFVAGDFFAAVPAGADCYLLKSILHNWDDAACGRILATVRQAAPPAGQLLLVERVRPARLRPSSHDEALARTDLNMLAGLGGRERSLAEFAALLGPAGFEITAVSPTSHEFSVIVARRVD